MIKFPHRLLINTSFLTQKTKVNSVIVLIWPRREDIGSIKNIRSTPYFLVLDTCLRLEQLARFFLRLLITVKDFGGLVSNSTVVKLNPQLSVSLADILNTKDNYKPKYPAIRSFRESDVLLIKQTLDRHHQYKNETHGHAISELATIVAAKLNIEGDIPNKEQFLKTLIKDYIVLTR